jgi:hypothetical protein
MGNCLCIKNINQNEIIKFALKFPNGVEYINFDNNKNFQYDTNINNWIQTIYKNNKFTNWIIYNDDIPDEFIKKTTKGHTKGILAWSNTKISWMCHSVPKFPIIFNSEEISEIHESEQIYGQSFLYTEYIYSELILDMIFEQLKIMRANIYIKKLDEQYKKKWTICKNNKILNIIKLNKNITHVSKSPSNNIDIWSNYLCENYKFNWKIAT